LRPARQPKPLDNLRLARNRPARRGSRFNSREEPRSPGAPPITLLQMLSAFARTRRTRARVISHRARTDLARVGAIKNRVSFGAGKPDSVPRLAALWSSFLSTPSCDGVVLPGSVRERTAPGGMQHTRGYGTGRPATYFALHRKGFFVPSRSRGTRWALTPPFHPCCEPRQVPGPVRAFPPAPCPCLSSRSQRFVFCDTVRRHALTRAARACGEACAASCPAVSGLSSPNVYRARVSPRLGIKELGATTRPQS
jgi:hypothetical protein